MKIVLLTFSIVGCSAFSSSAQEVLLKGNNTSMVNLYGDVKLLSVELTKNPKSQVNTHTGKGFKVQAYYGTDKKSAEQIKSSLAKKYAKQKPVIQFDAPTYWVKLGNFLDRNEAEQFLNTLTRDYPNAVVVPDQIIITTK